MSLTTSPTTTSPSSTSASPSVATNPNDARPDRHGVDRDVDRDAGAQPLVRLSPAWDDESRPEPPVGAAFACGFCRAEDSDHRWIAQAAQRPLGRREHFAFRSCRQCEAVFLVPRPNGARLAAAYDGGYYGTSERKFIAPIEKTIELFRSSRARRVASRLSEAGRVLDIGCGNGGFLRGIAARGFTAKGIERPGGSADRAMTVPDIDVHIGTLEDGHFADERFEAVTLWHVFEHLTEPQWSLELIADLLLPGGRLYLSLPNPESWQARIFGGHWLHNDPPRHLFLLGPDALRREVERYGFEQESISFVSLEQNPVGIAQSLLNLVLDERDVLFEALKGNRDVLDRYHPTNLFLQKMFFAVGWPLFAALSLIESAAGRGGCMELVFIRTEHPRTVGTT